MATVGYFGFDVYHRAGYDFRFPVGVRKLFKPFNIATDNWAANTLNSDCNSFDNDNVGVICKSVLAKQNVVVWGDSYAASLIPGMNSLSFRSSFNLIQFSHTSCPPLINISKYIKRKSCDYLNEFSIYAILRLQPQILILSSAFTSPVYSISNQVLEERLNITLQLLKEALPNTQVIIVGPTPNWPTSPQRSVIDKILLARVNLVNDELSFRTKLTLSALDLDEAFKKIAISNHVTYISPIEIFCNKSGECLNRSGNSFLEFYFLDYGHMSNVGSAFFASKIKNHLSDALAPQSAENKSFIKPTPPLDARFDALMLPKIFAGS